MDIEVERKRLQNLFDKTHNDSVVLDQKLSNRAFLQKAPRAVVEKYQKKKESLQEIQRTLKAQLNSL